MSPSTARRALLAFMLVGCAAETKTGSAPPVEPDPESPYEPSGESQQADNEDLEALPSPEDPGTKPEERPEPGPTVRTCDAPLTEAKPLRRSRISTKTKPAKLGAAILDGKVSTTLYVQGTPTPPEYPGKDTLSTAAADVASVAYYLGWDDKLAPNDLYSTHVNGKNPVQIWAEAMTPTSRRMTFTFVASAKEAAFRQKGEKRTAAASGLTSGEYVRMMAASKSVGISLVFNTTSDCATGALADLLGRKPIVRDALGTTGSLLDPAKRAAIQDLLVRDGTQVMVAAITSRPNAKIDKLVDDTTCSPTDLAACAKVVDDLVASASEFLSTEGKPTYETLSAATDPDWAFATFTRGDVSILP